MLRSLAAGLSPGGSIFWLTPGGYNTFADRRLAKLQVFAGLPTRREYQF